MTCEVDNYLTKENTPWLTSSCRGADAMSGLDAFFSMIDDMRARPTYREGDTPLPTLVVRGNGDALDSAAEAFRHRRNHPPRAQVTVSLVINQPRYEIVADVLRRAADELGSTAPPGEARIRFLLLDHVLWLMRVPLPEKQSEINAVVKQELRGRRWPTPVPAGHQSRRSYLRDTQALADGPVAAAVALAVASNLYWVSRLALIPAVLSIMVSLLLAAAATGIRGRTWVRHVRYRWFRRQPYGWHTATAVVDRPTGIEQFAEKVMDTRFGARVDGARGDGQGLQAQQADVTLQCLLVNAFLEDLRQAYARNPWKFWRRVTWTRTVYPLLLVDGDCAAVVERFEQVRAETVVADPLLLVALPADGDSQTDQGAVTANVRAVLRLDDSAHFWPRWKAGLAAASRIGYQRVITIPINGEDSAARASDHNPTRQPRRKPFLSRLSVAIPMIMLLLVAPPVYLFVASYGTCQPGIERTPTGECVGIGDDGFAFNDRLGSVLRYIDENNKKILDSGSPYATVMYLAAMSVAANAPVGADDLLADIHGELAGAAIAQRRRILSGRDDTLLQLRILPVNAGAEFAFAPQAAQAILRRMDEDGSIVGVVGLNESWKSVQAAILKLSQRALPMVSTAATYDDLGKENGFYLPSFFPLAPSNSELARHAAHWAKTGIPDHLPPATSAVVFADTSESDLYTGHLGRRFQEEFGKAAARIEPFKGADSLQNKINNICLGSTPRPDLIFFAGRAGQFGEFVDVVTGACPGITVMAGDSVAQYVSDRGLKIALEQRMRLFYTPLASASSWSVHPDSEKHRTSFDHDLAILTKELKLNEEPVNRMPAPDYAALAADATEALMRAAQHAYSMQRIGGADTSFPVAAGVTQALERLQPMNGASGMVKLHGGDHNHHALNRPVLLVKVQRGKDDNEVQQVVIAQCGKLFIEQVPDANCPKAPNPTAP